MSKVLHLTLKKAPFEVMVTGEKRFEYRKPSKWIIQRLKGREYDVVKFVNGYGNDKPYFIAKYGGATTAKQDQIITYSNGLSVDVKATDIVIYLNDIIETGNLKPQK